MSLDWMAQDLKEGIRRLTRHPRFTLLATGTLTLGLASSTAVFSYVNAYLRPFPGVAADRLYQIWFATEDEPWNALSYPDYRDLVELDGNGDGDLFSVTGFDRSSFGATVRRDQRTELAVGQSVSGRIPQHSRSGSECFSSLSSSPSGSRCGEPCGSTPSPPCAQSDPAARRALREGRSLFDRYLTMSLAFIFPCPNPQNLQHATSYSPAFSA